MHRPFVVELEEEDVVVLTLDGLSVFGEVARRADCLDAVAGHRPRAVLAVHESSASGSSNHLETIAWRPRTVSSPSYHGWNRYTAFSLKSEPIASAS